MSAVEERKGPLSVKPTWQTSFAGAISNGITKLLNLLSSVRFGVTLLVLLVIASMIGMLIMQQNVDGFDKYYAELTPSQQLLYGRLGWFDIYHVWYFNALLLVLSLNIVLASIDRFPKAWTFISRKKLDAGAAWLRGQEQNAVLQMAGESRQNIAGRIAAACRTVGLKARITEKGARTFVFAEKDAWNRLGAYAVHVALLTIFTGGFLTSQFGRTGQMFLTPGMTSNEMMETQFELDQQKPVTLQLPFEVTCTDIQQKLIRDDGPITANNTIDWLTRIKIKDETGEHEALVHMNTPFDYRGYRFFQASFAPAGKARSVTVQALPEKGGEPLEVTLPRGGEVTLPDGTNLALADFWADVSVGAEENVDTSGYQNPAAVLNVRTAQGQSERAFAFPAEMAENAPIAKRAVGGYTYRLIEFEKAAVAHILSIQHDPGSVIVYIGFGLLGLTLVAVFFFSHQRVWAAIEEKAEHGYEVTLGGNTNRNKLAFETRFKRLINTINGHPQEVEES
jgi:cytochrome c biogenesis protein